MDKDLQYYLDNPDDLPDDPAVLAQLAEQMTTSVVAEDPPPPEKKDEKPADPAPSSEEPKKAEEPQAKEEGDILMPSGKGTIPYAVLKSEREKRQTAEAAVAQLSTKVEEIQAQLAKGTQSGAAKAEAIGAEAIANLDPEELDALRVDFPVFGKVIDTLMGTIGTLSKQVDSLTQTEEARTTTEQRNTAQTVQELIDSDPLLLHLQTTDPTLFAKAVDIDKTLMDNPRYPDMASRFAKVSEIMASTFGPFEGVKAKAPAAKPAPPIDKDAARKAVLDKIETTKATPNSLSDLPSGEAPASDEMANLEALSAVEISDRMMKMTSDQRTAFLNRIH